MTFVKNNKNKIILILIIGIVLVVLIVVILGIIFGNKTSSHMPTQQIIKTHMPTQQIIKTQDEWNKSLEAFKNTYWEGTINDIKIILKLNDFMFDEKVYIDMFIDNERVEQDLNLLKLPNYIPKKNETGFILINFINPITNSNKGDFGRWWRSNDSIIIISDLGVRLLYKINGNNLETFKINIIGENVELIPINLTKLTNYTKPITTTTPEPTPMTALLPIFTILKNSSWQIIDNNNITTINFNDFKFNDGIYDTFFKTLQEQQSELLKGLYDSLNLTYKPTRYEIGMVSVNWVKNNNQSTQKSMWWRIDNNNILIILDNTILKTNNGTLEGYNMSNTPDGISYIPLAISRL